MGNIPASDYNCAYHKMPLLLLFGHRAGQIAFALVPQLRPVQFRSQAFPLKRRIQQEQRKINRLRIPAIYESNGRSGLRIRDDRSGKPFLFHLPPFLENERAVHCPASQMTLQKTGIGIVKPDNVPRVLGPCPAEYIPPFHRSPQCHIQHHHHQKARQHTQGTRVGMLAQMRLGNQLLYHHIDHRARSKAEKPGHQRRNAARDKHGQDAADGLHDT